MGLELLHHEGTKDTKVTKVTKVTKDASSSVEDTPHSIAKQFDVEIDQQAKPQILKPQVGQELRPVDRNELLNRLYLYDDALLYE